MKKQDIDTTKAPELFAPGELASFTLTQAAKGHLPAFLGEHLFWADLKNRQFIHGRFTGCSYGFDKFELIEGRYQAYLNDKIGHIVHPKDPERRDITKPKLIILHQDILTKNWKKDESFVHHVNMSSLLNQHNVALLAREHRNRYFGNPPTVQIADQKYRVSYPTSELISLQKEFGNIHLPEHYLLHGKMTLDIFLDRNSGKQLLPTDIDPNNTQNVRMFRLEQASHLDAIGFAQLRGLSVANTILRLGCDPFIKATELTLDYAKLPKPAVTKEKAPRTKDQIRINHAV